jgi:hypothetical protein
VTTDTRHTIELEYIKILHEKLLSYRFAFPEADVWLPKSQIVEMDEDHKTVTIPEWLAVEKELV